MYKRIKKYLLSFSLAINLFVALPALVLLIGSDCIQYQIYHTILAKRFGKPEIVFIGDSITRGGNIWAFRLGRYDFNVWNFGHGGFTTREIEHYAKKAAGLDGVRYAFVMAGTNDPDQTIAGAENTFENYKRIIDILRNAGITPIIQLTLYREDDHHCDFIDRLNSLLVAHAKENNIHIIDLNSILAPGKSLLPEYSKDGLHLTENAYNVWSLKIREVISTMDTNPI